MEVKCSSIGGQRSERKTANMAICGLIKAWAFNGKLRDELLDRKICDTLLEAMVLLTGWKREYNAVRLHAFQFVRGALN